MKIKCDICKETYDSRGIKSHQNSLPCKIQQNINFATNANLIRCRGLHGRIPKRFIVELGTLYVHTKMRGRRTMGYQLWAPKEIVERAFETFEQNIKAKDFRAIIDAEYSQE